MNQSQPIRTAHNLPQRHLNLRIIIARENPHHARHRPRIPGPLVRTTHSIDNRPPHKVRVVGAEDDGSGGLVDGVADVEVAEKGGGEEGGDVGVVHDVRGAEAINLVGVDLLASCGEGNDAVLFDRLAQGGGQGGHLRREVGLGAESCHYLCCGVEVARKHHVGGDEELEDTRVVGGAEGRADEAGAGLDGVADAAVGEGLGAGGGEALEGVGGDIDGAVGGIGGGHHGRGDVENGLNGGKPLVFAEEGGVLGGGVVVCGDFEEGGEGVELVFALEDGGVGVRGCDVVVGGGAVDGGFYAGLDGGLEGVAVGGGEEVAGL